jgi:hypothetical protein
MPRAKRSSSHKYISRGIGYAAWNVSIARGGQLFRKSFLDACYRSATDWDAHARQRAKEAALSDAIKWRDQIIAECDAKGWFSCGKTKEEGNAAWRALNHKPRTKVVSQLQYWLKK